MGREFWFTFPFHNGYTGVEGITLTVFASGRRSCEVTVANPNTEWSVTDSIVPDSVLAVEIPYGQCCTWASGVVANTGIRVSATDTISVFVCMSSTSSSSEMSCIIPVSALGRHYMVQCYPSKPNDYGRAEFVVVATEDSTHLRVNLTANALDDIALGSYSYILNAGQVIQFRGSTTDYGDLTGSVITADKNVSVLSGHFCAYIPTTASSCDQVFDHHLPIDSWGTRFVARTVEADYADRVRIMPRYDNTDIFINGSYAATANAGTIYETTVSVTNPTAYIETCGPALVYLFMSSMGPSTLSDPSMMPILPVEQMAQDITFCTYHTYGCHTHYINIVTITAEVPYLRLDGSSIASSFQVCSGNTRYSTAQVQLDEGVHRLYTLGTRGFFGYACSKGNHESYAYSIGSKLISTHSLKDAIYEGFEPLGDSLHICQGRELNLYVGSSYGVPDSIIWYLDGVRQPDSDTLVLALRDTGCYQIACTVYSKERSNCYPTGVRNHSSVVCLHPVLLQYDKDSIGVSRLPWQKHGLVYYDSVKDDTIKLVSQFGCDSTFIYTLYVYDDTLRETYYDTICAGEAYSQHGFSIPSDSTLMPGTFIYHYARPDTPYVAILYLTQLATPSLDFSVEEDSLGCYNLTAVTEADRVRWNAEPDDPTLFGQESLFSIHVCPKKYTRYSITAWYSNLPDCRAEGHLVLDALDDPSAISLWIPNAFAPDQENNNVFKVFGHDVVEFEIHIFQRRGEMVYHSYDIDQGWDGTKGGVKCLAGNYVYKIYYRSKQAPQELQVRFGSVLLIR